MINKRLLSVMSAALLGACSMTPDYQRPAAPVPAAWPESVKLKVPAETVRADWKRYFPDPRLQALIATALENNRDLRIATARVAEARAQYGIQSSDRYPNISLNASHSATRTPASVSALGSTLTTRRNDLNVALVSYEIDFWGRVSSLNESAKANYLATEEAQSAFRFSLIADVANAYLSLLELQERAALSEATVTTREATKEMVARRRDLGVSGDMDYLQAEGAYQAALAELANLERQRNSAANLLDTLLGQPIAELKELPAGSTLGDQGITPVQLAGLPAEVLLNRPDVSAAEQRLIAANANIGAARAAFFPRISLTGSFGTASRDLSGLFDMNNRAWNYQPVISLPLFDAGRTSDYVDVAKARKVIAVAEYEKTIQQAFREVADLLDASERLSEQLVAQHANAEAQQKRLRLVEARFEAGIASHLEVLDAQRESYAATQGEIQVRRMWLSVAAQLYKALGGDSNESSSSLNS